MVNVIHPNHVDEVPMVEPNQHHDDHVVPKPVLVDEDEDPEEDEFEEEEDPQEEEDDIEIDIEEDGNELELTYPYEEVDPLNPLPLAFESEPDNEIEVENPIEHEDETVPASVYEVGESSAAPFLREDSDSLRPGLMRMDINSLFARNGYNGNLVEKLGNTKDKVDCKKLKNELKEARFSNTFLRMQNERVKRNIYWTRVRAHEFYQEMIHRGFVFEERPNEAINVPIEDEKNPIDASASGPVRGQDAAPAIRECTFVGFMKCNPAVICGVEGAVELRIRFEKTKSVFEISKCVEGKKVKFVAAILEGPALTWWKTKVATMGLEMVKEYDVVAYTQRFNELALMCVRMVEPERVKADAYIRGLTDNIKGEVTSPKPANLSKAVRKKQKWESLQGVNSSGKVNQRDNPPHTFHNSQKERNARAWVTAPTDGKLPLCERCFTHHVGQCMIKCHKCGKVKQKEVGKAHGRAYAIKDVEPQGLNVVTGTFLLNNRYAFVLFDLGSRRSFVDPRFSAMLDIDPIKIGAIYEVELADERVASTNIVLKGCTLNLVNHIFEIDLMLIELGTFDVIIDMDWLVKHDAAIVCGRESCSYTVWNEMLIVESDKGVSRLKSKSKEKRMKDVPVIRDFSEVFPGEFLGLPPPRQVEFQIDLVPGVAPVARAPYRLTPSEMKEL
uniref:Reverse transcriptase domain-containing protein n=1 Tax=Tanacetum cinerariifolium TaxID=118510 RepID=A0A6L2KZC5_TANCI|nr:hypothetical protein [Tanacetum cinerariifolium]